MSEHKFRRWFRAEGEWWRWGAGIVAVLVAIALVAWLLVSIGHIFDRLAAAEIGLKANADRLEQVGIEPPATPEPKDEPEASNRRVTEDQVRTIVRSELAGLDLTDEQIDEIARRASTRVPPGEPGRRGRQGESPSKEMLRELMLEAVEQVCADNACKGGSGEPGADGTDGEDGSDGQPGDPGADGRSAYQIWLDAGNEGSEADFLASLEGSDGADGVDGQDGKPGPQGDTGPAGYPESFTFTVERGLLGQPTTYRCTDPDGDHHYTCEESGGD